MHVLPPEIAALREIALRKRSGCGSSAVLPAEAQAWLEHTSDEDWLIWRARRTAAKLASMPIDVDPKNVGITKRWFENSIPYSGGENSPR